MKNFKNILALVVLSIAFYSCDAEVTMDNPQAETIAEDGPGDQGNDIDERDEED